MWNIYKSNLTKFIKNQQIEYNTQTYIYHWIAQTDHLMSLLTDVNIKNRDVAAHWRHPITMQVLLFSLKEKSGITEKD